MARGAGKSIPARLNSTEILITNALSNKDILDALTKVGFGSGSLGTAKGLFDSATSLKDLHLSLMGSQKEATAAARAAKKKAIEAYQGYSIFAKSEFRKSKETLSKLGLNRAMPRSEAALIESGKSLFSNGSSDPVIKAAMLKYGYDDAKLTEESTKVLAFEKANADQKAAEGATQNSTDEQTRVMKELNDWAAQFRKAARVALKDKPQLLEKLGIRARSTKTKAQRGAVKKAAATRAAKKSSGGSKN